MGGKGSGTYRKSKSKATTADFYSLDLRKLNKVVSLDSNCGFRLAWKKKNEVNSSVVCNFIDGVLEIHYSIHGRTKQTGIIDYVNIATTPCHFGGERQWLVCPGCNNKTLVLYVVNRFRCRKCHGLYHPSSNEGELFRATRALCHIQDKLNGTELSPTDGIATLTKPKGMRYKTYFRLHNEACLRHRKFFEQYKRALGVP